MITLGYDNDLRSSYQKSDIYLMNNPAKFHPDPIWIWKGFLRGSLQEEEEEQQQQQQE